MPAAYVSAMPAPTKTSRAAAGPAGGRSDQAFNWAPVLFVKHANMQRPQVLKIKHGVSRAAGQPCSLLLLAFVMMMMKKKKKKKKKKKREHKREEGLRLY